VQVLGDHDLEERDDRVASAEARFPRLVKSFTMRFRGNVAGAWPIMTMRVSGLSTAMSARLIGQVR
jgi:hypothetical protein